MVQDEIINEVKSSEQFSVMVDETKRHEQKGTNVFVVRYYYNGILRENFLEFQEVEGLDAASLTEKIISSLEKHGLEYRENLVGQGYTMALQ